MAYLLEDRSGSAARLTKNDGGKKKNEAPKDSWLSDAFPIQEKQNLVIYGSNPCPRRQLAVSIRTQILGMLHYLPRVLENQFLSPCLCKDLMLKEKESILELTDQARPIAEQLGLRSEEYSLADEAVDECNREHVGSLTVKLQALSYRYNQELAQREALGQGAGQHLGGTLRLTKQSGRGYDRLQDVQKNILAYGLLSADFGISSKTSKLLQKLMIFGSLEARVHALDQIVYVTKELMIEQLEDFHLPMLLQQLVSCIKLWHHTEIHRLRLNPGPLEEQLSGVPVVAVSSGARTRQGKSSSGHEAREGLPTVERVQTYADIQGHLYLFDLLDAVTLIGLCNKEKVVRSLALVLLLESSKLKRLIAGQDKRKSLADLLYYNELAIRDRVSERMTLVKLFKSRGSKDPSQSPNDTFTRTYARAEMDEVIANLSFVKVIEDSFDYRQAKINESFARDVAVQYVGELATLWKAEFKSLAVSKKQQLKDSTLGRLRRQHRIIGQKILNFVFNVSRRAVLAYETKVDASRLREGAHQQESQR
jgi:hypothetical protein